MQLSVTVTLAPPKTVNPGKQTSLTRNTTSTQTASSLEANHSSRVTSAGSGPSVSALLGTSSQGAADCYSKIYSILPRLVSKNSRNSI